ncbi:hypothetical protein VP1G_11477 [Cytospora mali]|uniref:Uncharacterized protein n=1 Tax=Cytospora mali TaxID=578113 RepID=A0A194VGG1_CYTMA|nr:hypothetical protein VP1G_11477 [Valsa mali var. pyri (nom. inval.)]
MPVAIFQFLQDAYDFAHDGTDQDAHNMASAGYGSGHQVVTWQVSCITPRAVLGLDHYQGPDVPSWRLSTKKRQGTLSKVKDAKGFIFPFGF